MTCGGCLRRFVVVHPGGAVWSAEWYAVAKGSLSQRARRWKTSACASAGFAAEPVVGSSLDRLLRLSSPCDSFHQRSGHTIYTQSCPKLPEGAKRLAGGEARLAEREPPDDANHAPKPKAACRRYARAVRELLMCSGRLNASRIPPACAPEWGRLMAGSGGSRCTAPRFRSTTG